MKTLPRALVILAAIAVPAGGQKVSTGSGLVTARDLTFSITAPAGWVLDNQKTRKDGPLVVIYREGDDWRTGDCVMYVNTLAAVDQSPERFAHSVEADSGRWLGLDSAAVIRRAPPLRTADGRRATVLRYASGSLPSYEAVAYISEPSVLPLLVLTARTRVAFERSLPDFERLVRSYAPTHLRAQMQ